MNKKLAFIAAAALLMSAGCGKINDPADEAEEITTAAETETETAAEEETTDSTEKMGTEFFMLPDIRLGMTEEEVKTLIDTDFERSEKKLNDFGPDVVYYNIPFDSFPYLGIDMEGYELLAFVPDGELISMTCHFGVTDRDHTVKNKHSEEEIKAVYDKLFQQIHEHYGDYYNTNDKFDNFIGDAGWSNSFGTLSVTAVYLPDKETGDVYMQDISDEAYSKLIAGAKEKAQEGSPESSSSSSINVLTELRMGMTEEEVFSVIGDKYDHQYDRGYDPSVEYDYRVTADEVFGTGLDGYMFIEFNAKTHQLICCGYHLGAVGNVEDSKYPYSEEQLAESYGKIIEKLTSDFGSGLRPEEYAGEGIKDEMSWADGSDQLWAIYGTDLWSLPDSKSGVNEIIVSRSIER